MIQRTKSKKQVISESQNLLLSLLEKQRKANTPESLKENTSVWVKFCVLHRMKEEAYTLFIEQCEDNELIEKKENAFERTWTSFKMLVFKPFWR